MTSSMANARNQVRQVARFLERIHERGRSLASLTQSDVDEWFARPGALPGRARVFLVWAQRRHHVPNGIDLPPAEHRTRREVGDDATRWALARRVVVDDDLAADIRVAAALVLLYGQPLARIARLARDSVHRSADGTTVLDLDGHPLPIHEPFAGLVEQLPLRRQRGIRDQPATDWLFPGANATHHVVPSTLGTRLRELGIEARLMRNTARAQLAAEIPAALLSEIIGITPNTAVAWANRAAGNWATYAAHRASTAAETTQH
jgi:lambda repressor-like predicted transcriptional regulator